jgi:acyl carrier protein
MNGLPKARNKLLRIKLSERMDLPTLTDSTSLADRYYEAACPPSESGLGVKINKSRCRMDHDLVSLEVQDALGAEIEVFTRINEADGFLQVLLFGKHRLRGDDEGAKRNAASLLNNQLRERVHGYLVPRSVHFMDGSMPLCEDGSVDRVAIGELLKAETRKRGRTQGPVQEDVVDIFATVLHCSQDGVDPDTDFFEAGGDSLRAGRLISMLRRHFKVQLASQDLYSNSTVSDLVTLIELALPDRSEKQATEAGAEEDRMPLPGCTETHSLTRPLVLLLHLLPLTVVYPLRLAFWWTLSLYGIANLSQKLPFVDHIHGRLLLLLLVVAGATTTVSIVVPLFGIATKWVVVGKHKEGVHPMWASYHNRWWFVQKVFLICGKVRCSL